MRSRLQDMLPLFIILTMDLFPPFDEPFRAILLFGAPGSGKGTLGRMLSGAGNHFHLSSGDIFRSLSKDCPAGTLYYAYASKGRLVPDEITMQICFHYVSGLIATNRYFPRQQLLLLDGIPRTLEQAKLLEKHARVLQIILLEMDNTEQLFERMKKRARLEGRHDDKDEEVLRTRMEVYQKETLQLLTHYPSALVSRFNADQRPIEVLRDVLVRLSSLI